MAAHTNVCVIGLGSMGMGAARACLQAGLNTWGVDINPDNCRALLAYLYLLLYINKPYLIANLS
ncbi:NAD(P)-binding domain-containing protein, partial [Klebsiella pneumoniae]